MSTHSRSSSEIEPLQYSEVLPVFIKLFCKDFEFADVKQRVECLFTKDEFTAILEEKEQDEQIFRLFWVLCAKEHIIESFLDKISYEYKWLADKVRVERNKKPNECTERYVEALKILRSSNQKHTDYNVHRLKPYLKLRRALKKLKPYHNVVLLGDLGTGKKWLARDVCCEYSVLKAMNFKIYSIDVGKCNSPEEDLRMLQHFLLLLIGSSPPNDYFDSISNRILDLQQKLRAKLASEKYQNSLLVLKNVQNVKTWKAFNLGCKMLLITRNKKVSETLSPKMSEHITIENGLDLNEFYCLFEKYLRCSRDKFPPNATDIFYNSKGHPQLLSIIAQNLRQSNPQNNNSWNEWIQKLQNLQFTDDKFATVIDISLNVLSPELLELFATLAIFPHGMFIPVQLLAVLWNKTLEEAEKIVSKFHKFSIVLKDFQSDSGAMICKLPFIYSSHLKTSNRIKDLINIEELHRKIIDHYKIEETFNLRTEIGLCTSLHDFYFFSCIGYHLHVAERYDLLAKIYFDFGFLAQKLRAVGLLNTIVELKYYKNEKFNEDTLRRELLTEIIDFLPKVEEKLVHSKDTCLLQYALMASGLVYEEATRQVKQFPDNVWFTEKGNFHQRREIVNLPERPKIVHFIEPNICLILLHNNNILLTDISLDCMDDPVYFINDKVGDATIIDMRLFRNDNFILTLDIRGELKLWSIEDDRRRSKSSMGKVNPLNFSQCTKNQTTKKFKQSIHENIFGKSGNIVAFHIEQLPPNYGNETYLHVAFDNGEVCVFIWNAERKEFQSNHVPILPTRLKDIRFLSKILKKYYMLLNTAGDISFWNLKDSSKVPVSFEWPKHKTPLISYEIYIGSNNTFILFVFGDKILRLTFEHQNFSELGDNLETLYKCDDITDVHSPITCAKLSRDGKYLVLGTKRGLIVFDTLSKSEILRSNVSENVTCVDISLCNDRRFKYSIICGSENKKVLKMFALRRKGSNSIGWSHHVSTIGNVASNDPQLEPDVWLLGQKLYDISYDDVTTLVAADSKNRIHQVCTTNTKDWSIVMATETSKRITAITTYKQYAFAGYENGKIFNIPKNVFETYFTDNAISYLQLMDERILVASAYDHIAPKTCVRNFVDNIEKVHQINVKQCFKIFEHYLLLVNEGGIVLILDINKGFTEIKKLDEVGYYTLGGCDFKNSFLFLVTTSYKVYVYKFTNYNDDFDVIFHTYFPYENYQENKVTSFTVSNDANLFAIGTSLGDIDVYKMVGKQIYFLYRLLSHNSPIYDLKFSPRSDVLVSCSEQMCFWSVAHMLNNPFSSPTPESTSSQFSSQSSVDIEEVDAVRVVLNHSLPMHDNSGINSNVGSTINPWKGKRGPIENPELLACIKFDGNKAVKLFANEDFTQFNTIDDEGVYYHLKLLTNEDNDKVILKSPLTNFNDVKQYLSCQQIRSAVVFTFFYCIVIYFYYINCDAVI